MDVDDVAARAEDSGIRVTADSVRDPSRRDFRGRCVARKAMSAGVPRRDRGVRRRRGPLPGMQEKHAPALQAGRGRGLPGPGRAVLQRARGGLQQPDRHSRAGRDLQRHDERHELARGQLRQLGELTRAGLPVDADGLGHGDHPDVRRRHELRHRPLHAQWRVRERARGRVRV